MSDDHLTDSIFAGQPAPEQEGARAVRPPHRRRRGPVLIALAAIVVVVALVAALLALVPAVRGLLGDDDYKASDATGKKVMVTVPASANGRAIGEALEKAGVVKSADAFVSAAKADDRSQSIEPGEYLMPEREPAKQAVAYLADPAHRLVRRVTLREGLRATEIYAQLSKATGVPLAEYQKAAKNASSLGLPAAAGGNVEGWLFPASYEFKPGSTATQQLSTMVGKTKDVLAQEGVADDKAERTIILASIVEAESRLDADRGKVARVLVNRLAKPMRLQLDSTVAYATGKRVITTTDAERAQVNGYNTYTRDGLPVGPIGNPGAASIKAAANPTPGPWLFFVTVDPSTGETIFSETKAEHDQAVLKFQSWCQSHQGQC